MVLWSPSFTEFNLITAFLLKFWREQNFAICFKREIKIQWNFSHTNYCSVWSARWEQQQLEKHSDVLVRLVDRYAVSVLKDDNTVSHLPKKVAKVCSLFLQCGGSISCGIARAKWHSRDLQYIMFCSSYFSCKHPLPPQKRKEHSLCELCFKQTISVVHLLCWLFFLSSLHTVSSWIEGS